MNDQPRSSTQVTLEDLLRVKRAERPSPEFWIGFEQSLRAKQLAAIVDRKPWWHVLRLPQRWVLPAGAAALLGVGYISFGTVTRLVNAPQTKEVPVAQSETQAAPVVPVAITERMTPEIDVSPLNAGPMLAAVSTEAATSPTVSDPAPATDVPATQVAEPAAQERTWVDESATAYVAAAEALQNPIADLGLFFERATATLDENFRPARQPSLDPLAQLQTPGDARRARLLAFASDVDRKSPQYSNASNVIRSRERITSHLNDDALYDSIRRLGVKGNGVSIQF